MRGAWKHVPGGGEVEEGGRGWGREKEVEDGREEERRKEEPEAVLRAPRRCRRHGRRATRRRRGRRVKSAGSDRPVAASGLWRKKSHEYTGAERR
jgi:hypothetical protein